MKFVLFHTNADYVLGLRLPLLKFVEARSFDVVAFAPNMSPQHSAVLADSRIRGEAYALEATGLNPLKDLKSLWCMWRTLLREQPDYILTNNIKPVVYGTIAAFLSRITYRFCLVGGLGHAFIESNERGLRHAITRCLAQMMYFVAFRAATAVIFQNPDDLELMVSKGICPAKKARRVHGSGVDIEAFSPPSMRTESPVCIMVGRVMGEKGVREYFAAAKLVRERMPAVRFLLIGSPDSNPSSLQAEEIEALCVDAGVEWLGPRNDVVEWLRLSSIFVLPSYREGVPRSTLEAMACGLPVVTTDVPGCRETVEQGMNGYLVPPREPEKLADAVLSLCMDSDLRQRMGECSRRLAVEKFDVCKVNQEMAEIMGLGVSAGSFR